MCISLHAYACVHKINKFMYALMRVLFTVKLFYICMHMHFVILCIGKSHLGGKKEQEIRELYQEKLSKMESELKQLKGALKRHQHIIKSKVLYLKHRDSRVISVHLFILLLYRLKMMLN